MTITEHYQRIRGQIPEHVSIVIAAKQRTPEEIQEVIEAGATDLGENYVQEAERLFNALGDRGNKVRWHMIGQLQTNKINKALRVFDVIQTIDSLEKAEAIDKRVQNAGKEIIPVYVEINIGSELTKSGVPSNYEAVEKLARRISELRHVRLEGLMTLGPRFGDPEGSRPYFRTTREIFERIKGLNLSGVEMKTLSMGMSNSYQAAIEEGATMVRIGTAIFGERE
jgi:pyridoxal phosphate enzyme (YggS family)